MIKRVFKLLFAILLSFHILNVHANDTVTHNKPQKLLSLIKYDSDSLLWFKYDDKGILRESYESVIGTVYDSLETGEIVHFSGVKKIYKGVYSYAGDSVRVDMFYNDKNMGHVIARNFENGKPRTVEQLLIYPTSAAESPTRVNYYYSYLDGKAAKLITTGEYSDDYFTETDYKYKAGRLIEKATVYHYPERLKDLLFPMIFDYYPGYSDSLLRSPFKQIVFESLFHRNFCILTDGRLQVKVSTAGQSAGTGIVKLWLRNGDLGDGLPVHQQQKGTRIYYAKEHAKLLHQVDNHYEFEYILIP